SATLVSGSTQGVSFSASGLPAGASPGFNPTACSPNCQTQLTISTTGATPTGSFSITVTGNPLSRQTSFTLNVIPPPPRQGRKYDFNGDGRADILWRPTSGVLDIWLLNGTSAISSPSPGAVGTDWTIVGVGDFNGDGRADILWRHTSGIVFVWLMNGA